MEICWLQRTVSARHCPVTLPPKAADILSVCHCPLSLPPKAADILSVIALYPCLPRQLTFSLSLLFILASQGSWHFLLHHCTHSHWQLSPTWRYISCLPWSGDQGNSKVNSIPSCLHPHVYINNKSTLHGLVHYGCIVLATWGLSQNPLRGSQGQRSTPLLPFFSREAACIPSVPTG